MSAVVAICAWTLAACAAGVLASRRYGERARAVQVGDISRHQWAIGAGCALVLGATIAVISLGAGVGIAYWLSALAVLGAAITGVAAIVPRAPSIAVWLAAFIASSATAAHLWTT